VQAFADIFEEKTISLPTLLVNKRHITSIVVGGLFRVLRGNQAGHQDTYLDTTGFCLWQKRLEADTFPWPVADEVPGEVTQAQLMMLLRGIDIFTVHKQIVYTRVT
jgi:hypothetical protein